MIFELLQIFSTKSVHIKNIFNLKGVFLPVSAFRKVKEYDMKIKVRIL